ncbi:MAG: cob(I)yrinic acid a,c-diamide adenosyltransferase [Dehalococcoidales bacterium]|nr:cob(I)yrinic acid a,c-diamide adenosyltransferase [Dehalococcoidales bacterium]
MTAKKTQGLVQVFTGEGKGKTTAALGTVLRAAGHGFKISIIFFIKGHSSQGEYKTLAALPDVKVASFGLRQFIHKNNVINPAEKAQAQAALAAAREDVMSGKFDLVVLDEINVAVYFNLLSVDEVLQLIKDKPPRVELILTGRKADAEIIAAADLVTEMVKIKHPYDKGIKARKGIEF